MGYNTLISFLSLPSCQLFSLILPPPLCLSLSRSLSPSHFHFLFLSHTYSLPLLSTPFLLFFPPLCLSHPFFLLPRLSPPFSTCPFPLPSSSPHPLFFPLVFTLPLASYPLRFPIPYILSINAPKSLFRFRILCILSFFLSPNTYSPLFRSPVGISLLSYTYFPPTLF